MNEGFLKKLFKDILDIDIEIPLRRMPYKEAMERFGLGQTGPSLWSRAEGHIRACKRTAASSVFKNAVAEGGSVRAINAKGLASHLSRKEIDRLGQFVKSYKAKGLAYTRITPEGESSSYEKFLAPEEISAVRSALGAETGDAILIVADSKNQLVFDSLGALRCEIAEKCGIIDPKRFELLWVVDFPAF